MEQFKLFNSSSTSTHLPPHLDSPLVGVVIVLVVAKDASDAILLKEGLLVMS